MANTTTSAHQDDQSNQPKTPFLEWMCLLASQEQNCLTSAKFLSLTSFTLLRGWVWLWKTSEPLPLGQAAKGRTFPVNCSEQKALFLTAPCLFWTSAEVLELSAILIRQGLKCNMSDRSNQCSSQGENIWEVSSQNTC